jgi:hypothetical protein
MARGNTTSQLCLYLVFFFSISHPSLLPQTEIEHLKVEGYLHVVDMVYQIIEAGEGYGGTKKAVAECDVV